MTSDMLSQDEIDALLKGGSDDEDEIDFFEDEIEQETENILTAIEIDALGEIGNISMGTAATTLSTLLNRKVNITTPTVEVTNTEELAKEYVKPFVAVDVSYKAGLEGSNILILNSNDAKVITDLMMGKDEFDIERDLSEMDLSAVSEAMNQMMGSSSTSLSEMFMKVIDIQPPNSMEITFSEEKEKIDVLMGDTSVIKISFKMVIGDSIDSSIMQLIPLSFGRQMVENLMNPQGSNVQEEIVDTSDDNLDIEQKHYNQIQNDADHIEERKVSKSVDRNENINYNNTIHEDEDMVVVKKPEFKSFITEDMPSNNSSIDLVGDIPIDIVVELGKTSRKISEILEMGQGTVLELNKLVGEPLNIYANGKFIARGEVVVIDDSFGVRVTEIENTNRRII